MFPQWTIDKGLIKKNSLPAHFFRYFEDLNYRASDCIAVQSQANLELFHRTFLDYQNVMVLMNWTSISEVPYEIDSFNVRHEHNLVNKVIFFYGGNIGHAQDMTNIMTLAKNIRNYHDAHFLIVGQGDEFDHINVLKARWALKNVTILPAVPQVQFRKLLGAVDVGLFSLSKDHTAHNFPGKILGYMDASLPILGSVNPGNDLLTIINDASAGLINVNGDDDVLMKSAIDLVERKLLRQELGRNSKALLREKFSVESAVEKIIFKVSGERKEH